MPGAESSPCRDQQVIKELPCWITPENPLPHLLNPEIGVSGKSVSPGQKDRHGETLLSQIQLGLVTSTARYAGILA